MTTDSRFAALMQAAQQGDGDAYVQLMEEITPRLRQVIRRHRQFMGIEDIEDLVQEVLISVHAVRATYDPQRPFMPWLFAITRNRLADDARRYARRPREVTVPDLVTFAGNSTNTTREVYRDPDALRQAIEALPAGQRAAIEMLKMREMSLKEAAAASGMSIGALKIATHRAMTALRRTLVKDR